MASYAFVYEIVVTLLHSGTQIYIENFFTTSLMQIQFSSKTTLKPISITYLLDHLQMVLYEENYTSTKI